MNKSVKKREAISGKKSVRAIVYVSPPMVIRSKKKNSSQTQTGSVVVDQEEYEYSGFAIDMWQHISKEIGVEKTTYVETTRFQDFLSGVISGEYDIGLTSVTITSEREEKCDFTFPFYTTRLVPIVRQDMSVPLFQMALAVFTDNSTLWITVLIIALALAVGQYWIDKAGADDDKMRKFHKFSDAATWSAQAMVNASPDLSFHSNWNRAIGIASTVLGATVLAGYISLITTALSDQKQRSGIFGEPDLHRFVVGVMKYGTADDYANSRELKHLSFESEDDALEFLATNGKEGKLETKQVGDAKDEKGQNIQVVLGDELSCAYYISDHVNTRSTLNIVPINLQSQPYGIALKKGSLLREPINIALLKWLDSPQFDETVRKYRLNEI
jgi:polar amino acid transport system substrate-binding protein